MAESPLPLHMLEASGEARAGEVEESQLAEVKGILHLAVTVDRLQIGMPWGGGAVQDGRKPSKEVEKVPRGADGKAVARARRQWSTRTRLHAYGLLLDRHTWDTRRCI